MDDILQLSVAERVHLAEQIWDSVAAQPEMLPVTEAQRAELDRRLEALARDPAASTPWTEVRTKLERRR